MSVKPKHALMSYFSEFLKVTLFLALLIGDFL